MGTRFYADGGFMDAAKAYGKATKADPAFCAAWVGMGDALYAQKKYADAMQAYGEAAILIPAESSPALYPVRRLIDLPRG